MRPRCNLLHLATITLLLITPGCLIPVSQLPALAQTTENRKAEADRLVKQGTVESLQSALTLYRELGDRGGETQTLVLLSRQLLKLGNYSKMIELAQQGIVVTQARPDIDDQNRRNYLDIFLRNLAYSYQAMGQYDRSLNYLQQALDNARGFKEARIGSVFEPWILSDFAKCLSQAMVARLTVGDQAAVSRYTDQLAGIYQHSQAFPKDNLDKEFDSTLYSEFYKVVSEQANAGKYASAIRYAKQLLATAQRLNRKDLEWQVLGYLGELHYGLIYDSVTADSYYQKQLAIARLNRNAAQESEAFRNLGNLYQARSDYDRAIAVLQQSLQSARAAKDPASESIVFNDLADAYKGAGKPGKAIESVRQALAISQQNQDLLNEFNALATLSRIYTTQKSPLGIQFAQQGLAVAQKFDEQFIKQQQFIAANAIYPQPNRTSKAIDTPAQGLLSATALANLGDAYSATGDFSNAIRFYRQRLAIAQTQQIPQDIADVLTNLGFTLIMANQPVEAEPLLMQAVTLWESIRAGLENQDRYKVSIFERQMMTYVSLQKALVAQAKMEAALEVAERGRARAFVELLARRLFQPNQQSVAFSQALLPPRIDQIRQIAREQNATLVEYSVFYQYEILIWVIKPTGEVSLRRSALEGDRSSSGVTESLVQLRGSKPQSADVNTLTEQVNAFYRNLRGIGIFANDTPSPSAVQTQSQALYQQLIQPITDLLPTDPDQQVVFIPQGPLFLVPFAALQDASGKYLIERNTIRIAPSIQVLALTHRQLSHHQNSGNPLIVGNPLMPKVTLEPGKPAETLPPLPGAEQEAREIAQLLKTPMLTGATATETTVKQQMPNARWIHLATHGLLDDQRGIGSSIALAPSNKDDGLLTAEEILDMKLQAGLVVLSACDTGRGKITGDGVIGLSRSLIAAGVPSVVVSLWAVPDAPTASLMTQFYQNLQKQDSQKPDKAQALRQAMLTTMRQHPNPRDWAAFTLIGEAE